MNREHLNPNPSVIESLLAMERELVAESESLRERVLERARAALPRNPRLQPAAFAPRLRRLRIREMAFAAVALSAVCAAAYYLGYQVRSGAGTAQLEIPVAEAPGVVPLVSAIPAVSSTVTTAEKTPADALPAKAKPAGATKSVTDTEAYAIELRVLQPARQAVARHDYTAALGAISEHQRRFASGKLTEEREALRVKALLGLGRVAEAQRAGAAFRARFPHSALIGRIDDMLGTPK